MGIGNAVCTVLELVATVISNIFNTVLPLAIGFLLHVALWQSSLWCLTDRLLASCTLDPRRRRDQNPTATGVSAWCIG